MRNSSLSFRESLNKYNLTEDFYDSELVEAYYSTMMLNISAINNINDILPNNESSLFNAQALKYFINIQSLLIKEINFSK